MTRNQQKFLFFCLFLLIAGCMMVTTIWNSTAYYMKNFEVVKKHSRSAEEEPSKQPDAPGLRERDIKKYYGKGYSTF